MPSVVVGQLSYELVLFEHKAALTHYLLLIDEVVTLVITRQQKKFVLLLAALFSDTHFSSFAGAVQKFQSLHTHTSHLQYLTSLQIQK